MRNGVIFATRVCAYDRLINISNVKDKIEEKNEIKSKCHMVYK